VTPVKAVNMNGQPLQARLSFECPHSNPRLTEFPSGSFMIDLDVHGEVYVIEYVVGQGCGLSRPSTATLGFEGAEGQFETVEDLVGRIRRLMMELS
jgi:hypothetical protein